MKLIRHEKYIYFEAAESNLNLHGYAPTRSYAFMYFKRIPPNKPINISLCIDDYLETITRGRAVGFFTNT